MRAIAMAVVVALTGCRAVLGIEEGVAGEPADAAVECRKLVGSMQLARHGHSATTLPNGRVLVVGGNTTAGRTTSVEEYDPGGDVWRTSAMGLPTARSNHAAILLDDGTILIAGGYEGAISTSALVYSPTSGPKAIPATLRQRVAPSVVRLPDGRILIAGGGTVPDSMKTTEVFDPKTGSWTDGPVMSVGRSYAARTVLGVLGATAYVACGGATASEKFDLMGDAGWIPAGDLPFLPTQAAGLATSTALFVTARLSDGSVAAASNAAALVWSALEGPAERFAPELVAPLPKDRLLWVGGDSFAVLDTRSRKWVRSGKLLASHQGGALATLRDGRILLVGGTVSAIAEVFDPACLGP